MSRVWIVSLVAIAGCAASWGQETKPAKTVVEGCVTRSTMVHDVLVLRSKDSCVQLAGEAAKDSLLGHVVTLNGTLSEATSKAPETLQVMSVNHVGEICSETCTLEPPGRRGLRKKEVPAGPASTPGETQKPQSPDW